MTGSCPNTVSPVSIIPPVLYTRLHLHDAVTGRTNRRSKSGSGGQKALSHFVECKRLLCRVSGSFAVAGFGMSGAEPADAARSELDNHRDGCRPENFRFHSLIRKRSVERTEQLLRNATALIE